MSHGASSLPMHSHDFAGRARPTAIPARVEGRSSNLPIAWEARASSSIGVVAPSCALPCCGAPPPEAAGPVR
ncbi:hypothetical protein GLE_1127 [Lysobacter enzymogenes]|uniref:Uncharacterized protein n=1 Tax=Lysobacter enzymogenes TaxID=69 RepID=A0A0S2DDB8_LYSEN|nr:hypothetical protein GLE_1127 [Lysobacter enzymogenes]